MGWRGLQARRAHGHGSRKRAGLDSVQLAPGTYSLEVGFYDPADPNQYQYKGAWQAMRIIRENVRFQRNEIPCQVIGTLPFYTEVAGAGLVRGRFLCPTGSFGSIGHSPSSASKPKQAIARPEPWCSARRILRWWT